MGWEGAFHLSLMAGRLGVQWPSPGPQFPWRGARGPLTSLCPHSPRLAEASSGTADSFYLSIRGRGGDPRAQRGAARGPRSHSEGGRAGWAGGTPVPGWLTSPGSAGQRLPVRPLTADPGPACRRPHDVCPAAAGGPARPPAAPTRPGRPHGGPWPRSPCLASLSDGRRPPSPPGVHRLHTDRPHARHLRKLLLTLCTC